MMIDLSEFIRLPAGPETALMRRGEAAARDTASGKASFGPLVDRVNEQQLAHLETRIAGAAFLLAFVRGSLIKNRLAVSQTFWGRASECLGLPAITEQLEQTYGRQQTQAALHSIRGHVIRELLRDGDKMGPAKLVIRLRRPDDGLLISSNYPDVARFMNKMATLSAGCDAMVQSLFLTSSLGEARKPVLKQLRFLLERFELSDLIPALDAHFDEFIERLSDAHCLHPAVPVRAAAVEQVALLLGTDEDTARKAIILFRFAWICRLRKEKDFSDFTLKSLVVVPQTSREEHACRRQTGELLQEVFRSLQATVETCPALREFSRRFPDVRVRLTVLAMSLPAPLYAAFDRLETGKDRLDFLTKYHAGSDYLRPLMVHRSSPGSDASRSRLISQEWDDLYRRIIFLKTKTSKAGDRKHDHITPLGLSPASLSRAFAAVINDPGDGHAQHCGELLNKIGKDDLVRNIRGIWAVKS